MDSSYEDEEQEAAPLVPRPGIPTAIRDTRKPYQKQLAIKLILASLLFERISFYSIAANLVTSLGSNSILKWKYPDTLIATFIFSGTSYISTLIFAVISDAILGRAKTIIVGFFLYLIGYVLAILITNSDTYNMMCSINSNTGSITAGIIDEPCVQLILPTLIIIALGAGAVQSNMAVLGSEQNQESKVTSRYFDKYLVAVNIGSIIARLIIPSIQRNDKYYIGYVVAASTLFLAGLLFIIGWKFYIHVEPKETVVTNCIPVIFNACQTRNRYSSESNITNVSGSLADEEQSVRIFEKPATFLDYAKAEYHGKFQGRIVEDVKSLRNAFIVFTFFIPYWLVYTQIYSSFPLQGEHMYTYSEPRLVTWVSLGDPVTIVIGIIILNMFVYKCINARNRAVSIVMKFIVGMIFACITMCIAGSIEILREKDCFNNISSNDNSSSLSIFFQLPQTIGMGLSEIFAMVASYEFAYYTAPRSAQSLFMSLRFFSLGISSFIGFAYTSIFFPTPMKLDFTCLTDVGMKWQLYSHFYILAGIQFISMIIFIICQKKFHIIKLNPQQMERSQFVSQTSTLSTNR